MLKHRIIPRTACQLIALFIVGLFLSAWAQAAEMTVGKAIYHDTSAPMSDMATVNAGLDGENKQIPIMERPDYGRYPDLAAPDGGLQTPGSSLGPTPAVDVSASGLSDDDNAVTIGGRIVPPDVNGDIGLDDAGNRIYVQYINLIWGVYNDSGALINGPFAGNTFWAGFGGFCQSNNDGDPVVLYDDQAGRWFFSQFSINEGIQCVAVSTTSDPLGPYHRYAFPVTPGGANDYPKLGVWDDGTTGSTGQSAYTFTLRDFGGAGGSFSVSAGVMERDAMLTGAVAQFVKFSNPCAGGDCIEGQLPPHLAGPTPPAGTCPTFWTAVDAAYDDSPFANDGYRNHTLCVDWAVIGNSNYGEGPLVLAGTNFDRFLGGGFSDCISPVAGGEVLDCLAAFTMNRPQYRWFGTYASVVLNTTVDAGGDRAGIRWAETRSTDGDSAWSLEQDGTYAPADGLERWMGSIAQDGDGNIALGYSVTGSSLMPAVRYTSRMSGDAAGTMPGGEVSCHEGTGAQTASSNRWGDYSSMSIDPTDDCTFWYTQEYYEVSGSFDFNTRICSFRFADCGTVCTVDADCDDGAYCNGAETCNTGTGACEAGSPPICDDGTFCNGTETCNEGTDSCDAGTSPSCDDGVGCTVDSCNVGTDACDNVANDVLCPDDGQFCTGTEFCDPILDCLSTGDPCTGETCDEGDDICVPLVCNNNGVCESGEDCNNCANDCISGTTGAVCGNGLCEASVVDGENAANCSADCNGKLNGKPSNRFSCGLTGQYSVSCSDSRCTSSGFDCTETPADSVSYCCGDGFCEGAEDGFTCGLDCGPAPFCGDATCDANEDQCSCAVDCGAPPGNEIPGSTCDDGIDNDCGGGTDCSDLDCSTDPSCNVCLPKKASCSTDDECCSGDCKPNGSCR